MYDETQTQYLSEVLGVRVENYAGLGGGIIPSAGLNVLPVVVLTVRLTDEERGLLAKILSSVKLPVAPPIFEVIDLRELPEGVAARHIVTFGGASGYEPRDRSTWWGMPPLQSMLGTEPHVLAQKKLTWTLLRNLSEELNS